MIENESQSEKPLAGACVHEWTPTQSPYAVAEVCGLCKLFRYKAGPTADWEYRAPIPIPRMRGE
ncbi:MAG: hypothetical protein DMG22_18750 [Acidobacteria bacterium]|nr:MAG: hypothetical protein DMG22_18750 [Acidobacteriota bacterium]